MFANLTYQDKEAFFLLLDEYFDSRPHLQGSNALPQTTYHPTPSPSLPITRNLPVTAPARSPAPLSPPASASPSSPSHPIPAENRKLTREEKAVASQQKREDLVMRLAISSAKSTFGTAQRGLGAFTRNQEAMGAVGMIPGASTLVRGANDHFGKQAAGSAGGASAAGAGAKGPPPAPAPKKSGVSGLMSGKSFGQIDTSKGMSSFTSMFKDTPKAAPAAATPATPYQAPAMSNSASSLPPPGRRVAPAPEPEVEEEEGAAEGQAQAVYDYAGGDAGDLSVQTGQIVNIIEKTSEDWWTCEDGNGHRGLVPANYLKEM